MTEKIKYTNDQAGVKTAARRIATSGVDPEIQVRLDKACPSPHVHPRWKRNS